MHISNASNIKSYVSAHLAMHSHTGPSTCAMTAPDIDVPNLKINLEIGNLPPHLHARSFRFMLPTEIKLLAAPRGGEDVVPPVPQPVLPSPRDSKVLKDGKSKPGSSVPYPTRGI
eukprot:4238795-Pyramimonas_sp.AAC.1